MEESEDFQLKEFSSLCRLCSKATNEKKKVDLFGTTDDIIEKIYKTTTIQILSNDVLPICICEECSKHIHRFHKFQQQCLQTQQNLNQKISSLKGKENLKEEAADSDDESSAYVPIDVIVKLETDNSEEASCQIIKEESIHDNDEGEESEEDSETSDEEFEMEKGAKKLKTATAKRSRQTAKTEGEKVKKKPLTKEERKERSRAKYQTYLRPCDVCGQMIHKFRMQYHINTHNGVTPFKCDGDENCTKAFSCPYMMAVHKRDHHMSRVFTCELCGKSYTVQNSLRNHKQREHMAPKYECSVCGRKYKTSTYLKQHFRTHTGERPYLCKHDGCTKSFAKSYNLKIHIRSHTKEKPCKCPVEGCGNSYGYNCLLKQHIDKIHPNLNILLSEEQHRPKVE